MSKQTEALQLALEALKQIDEAMPFPVAKLAQKVIREALAEQPAQQEPGRNHWEDGDVFERIAARKKQPAQQQAPVAEVKLMQQGGNAGLATVIHEIFDPMREPLRVGDKLYTSPPASKPWVGLTDEEWQEIDASLNGKRDLARIFVKAIEAKLKEKNA